MLKLLRRHAAPFGLGWIALAVSAACSSGDSGTGQPAGPSCPGATLCGDKCADTKIDSQNCGACGTACAPDEVCSNGQCGSSCGPGTTDCGGSCIDTKVDPQNCGGCSAFCTPGELCSVGACALACGGGTTECGDKCIDTTTSSAHCGGCDQACQPGEICSAGTCTLECVGGTTRCGDKCVDTSASAAHCGGCDQACPPGQICSAGTCALECGGGTTKCGDKCVDTKTDPANCNGCGNPCSPGFSCVGGSCVSIPQVPECLKPTPILDAYRNVGVNDGVCNMNNCDAKLNDSWYRFMPPAGARIPTSAPAPCSCGTDAPGCLYGTYPAIWQGAVKRMVCFSWGKDSCNWATDILVRNCGDFFVFKLPKAPTCDLVYCAEN
ncbi:MAG: hypothetical protein HY744_06385 [Deltaproteobacteria bacterium]|nr:hypothetical protein [Deltaproteobacteria bacterium]